MRCWWFDYCVRNDEARCLFSSSINCSLRPPTTHPFRASENMYVYLCVEERERERERERKHMGTLSSHWVATGCPDDVSSALYGQVIELGPASLLTCTQMVFDGRRWCRMESFRVQWWMIDGSHRWLKWRNPRPELRNEEIRMTLFWLRGKCPTFSSRSIEWSQTSDCFSISRVGGVEIGPAYRLIGLTWTNEIRIEFSTFPSFLEPRCGSFIRTERLRKIIDSGEKIPATLFFSSSFFSFFLLLTIFCNWNKWNKWMAKVGTNETIGKRP